MFPFGSLEEMSRRNMEFLDQAFRAFNPLLAAKTPDAAKPESEAKTAAGASGEGARDKDALSDLQKKISALEKQIEAMGKKD
jgi:polyhydroxyalkanoate synthesis regulator protein